MTGTVYGEGLLITNIDTCVENRQYNDTKIKVHKADSIKHVMHSKYDVYFFSKIQYDIESKIKKLNIVNIDICKNIARELMYVADYLLVIIDKAEEKIYAMRSPNGVVPLYYYYNLGDLVISTNVHNILHYIDKPCLCKIGIRQYLIMNYLMEPYTFYDQVYEIRRDNVYEFSVKSDDMRYENYYKLEYNYCSNYSLDYYLDELKEAFNNAHYKRLGKKNGIFLSGGLDSVVMCTTLNNYKDEFHIESFNVSVKEQQNSEAPYARRVADYYHFKHNEILIDSNDVDEKYFDRIINSNFPYFGMLYIGGILDKLNLTDYNFFTGQDTRLHTPYLNSIDHLLYTLNKNDNKTGLINKIIEHMSSLFASSENKSMLNKICNRLVLVNDLDSFLLNFVYHINPKFTNECKSILDTLNINKHSESKDFQDFFNKITWVRWGQQYTDDIKYMDSLSNIYNNCCQFPFYDVRLAEVSASIPFKFSNKSYIGKSGFGNRISINKKYLLKKYLEKENVPNDINSRKKAVSNTIHLFFNSRFGEMVKERLNTSMVRSLDFLEDLELDKMIDCFVKENRVYSISDHEYLQKIYNLVVVDTLLKKLQ